MSLVPALSEISAYSLRTDLTTNTNRMVIVAGLTAVNDGIIGMYLYDETSTASDDGRNVIAPLSGGVPIAAGRWLRVVAMDGFITAFTTTGTFGAATYNSLTGALNIPIYANSGGTVTSVGLTGSDFTISGTPVTGSGNIALSLPTVNSNVGTFNNITINAKGQATAGSNASYLTGNQNITLTGDITGAGTTSLTTILATVNGNIGTFKSVTVNGKGLVTAASGMSFNNAPARSIVTTAAAANGFQISSTKDAIVNYSVKISCAVQIGVVANVEGYVVLEVCATNSSTAGDWAEIGRMTNGQNIALAIALSSTQVTGGSIGGVVQAGWYTRLRSVNTSGTPTFSVNGQQEVSY